MTRSTEIDLESDAERFLIRTTAYAIRGNRAKHRVEVLAPDTADIWLDLSLIASVHRTDRPDELIALDRLEVCREGEAVVVRATGRSSAWDSHVVELECRADEFRLRVRVRGDGRIRDVTLAGGDAILASGAAGTFRSGTRFDTVFSPAPSEPVQPLRPASAAVQLGVVGDAEPGRLHGLFSPPPLAFALGRRDREPGAPWLGIGLLTPVERCTFTTMRYEPLDGGFVVRLAYEGHTAVAGAWTSPDLRFRPVDESFAVVDDLRGALVAEGWAADPAPVPAWALEPIFCGWGAQCAAAVRRASGGTSDAGLILPAGAERAPDLAVQHLYDGWLDRLERNDLRPGTIVIDDRWQAEYGTNRPDAAKWPDLKAWIAKRHGEGQRVFLWLKAWDPEGLPAELCVRTSDGRPVAADPGNPAYLELLEQQVHEMLSPDGLDADGFKVDFTQRAPSGASLSSAADGPDAVWGVSALHALLSTIHRAAHRAKPDAVVITHAVDPRFGDVSDMVRLNDVLERDQAGRRVAVADQLRFRADVARRALPGHPIDTDQWPMPNRAEWLSYAREQVLHGVPALYYVTSIDNSDEDLTEADLAAVAETWRAYRGTLRA